MDSSLNRSEKGPGKVPHLDAAHQKIAIVHARWNSRIVDSLVAGAKSSLLGAGVCESNILIHSVPGSWELPLTCSQLIKAGNINAVIAIGVLIKGETMHFEYIADTVSHALMRVQLDTMVPVVFGLLTALNIQQAEDRAGITTNCHNHGEAWGRVAIEMGMLRG